MANETEEAQGTETQEQQPEETAAGQAAAAPEEPVQESAAEPAEEEPPKKEKKNWLGGILKAFVFILVVFILVFEAMMLYLWLRYDTIYPEQPEQSTSVVQQRRSTSAYANWGGYYRPADWPDAVASHAGLPERIEDLESGEEPEPGPDA